MCEICKAQNMARIDKNILDTLLIAADLTIEDMEDLGLLEKAEVQSEILNFEPNPNLGESPTKAIDEELEYRGALLKLAEKLHDKVAKIIKSKNEPLEKIEQIDDLIEEFISDGKDLVNETIPTAWDDSVQRGLKQLEDIDKNKYPVKDIDTEKQELILQQQLFNIEDIGLQLRGRLRQFILINAIQLTEQSISKSKKLIKATPTSNWTECMIQLHKREPDLTEDELRERCEWEAPFIPMQDNLDKLGVFGYLAADKEALYATMIMGMAILGDLIADWVTMGDNSVCEDCLEMEANGPYHILDWPGDQHFGDRCGMGNIRLASLEF